jgi:predicted transcriptional regulator of viral defense system
MKISILNNEDFICFTTRDYAQFAGISVAAASKQLSRAKDKDDLIQLTRGVWANTKHPYFSPLSCVAVLLGDERGYVSFLTALHHYGMISQIPATIQVATTGHTRRLKTPVGIYEFFQLKPELFMEGVDWVDTRVPYLIATVEKALLDTLYIATRKTRRFAKLPELDFEDSGFNGKKFQRLLNRLEIPSRIQSAIQNLAGQWEMKHSA